MIDPETAGKIKQIVFDYEMSNPQEFEKFKKQQKVFKELLRDENFASLPGSHVQERLLFELPETLQLMLDNNLTPEERSQIWNQTDRDCKGAIWFAKTFPAYRVPKKL